MSSILIDTRAYSVLVNGTARQNAPTLSAPGMNSAQFQGVGFVVEAQDIPPVQMLYVPSLSGKPQCSPEWYTPTNYTETVMQGPVQFIESVAIMPFGSDECNQAYFESITSSPANSIIVAAAGPNDPAYSVQNISQLLPPGLGISIYGVEYSTAQMLSQWVEHAAEVPNSTYYHNGDQGEPTVTRVGIRFASMQSGNNMPKLWVWVLAIVGSLLVAILTLSCILNFVQYKRRRDLRNRLRNGEIDLEQLGFIGVSAPTDLIARLPEKVYHSGDSHYEKVTGKETVWTDKDLGKKRRNRWRGHKKTDDVKPQTCLEGYSQSSCPICLDDYEENETTVLELPCRHIFHPDCIRPFLETRSCLCPLCKQSILPKGYLPPGVKITNLTVRRERMIRLGHDVDSGRLDFTLSGFLGAYRRRQERNNPNLRENGGTGVGGQHLGDVELEDRSGSGSRSRDIESREEVEETIQPQTIVVVEAPGEDDHQDSAGDSRGSSSRSDTDIPPKKNEQETVREVTEDETEHTQQNREATVLAHEIVQRNVQAIDEQIEQDARDERQVGGWRRLFPFF
ncbi:putative RING finger membrane protein [Yarrowia sp. C11]|nr:putative RING finger membrane protein [Yarrowia sp. E02]KAG5369780.1 putative RING finger membrane protein [Yarrowia sp. C11]